MMKKVMFTGLMIGLLVSACSKKPWEDYSIPVDLADNKERTDTTIIKVLSVGIFHDNTVLTGVADVIKQFDPDFALIREVDHGNTRSGIDVKQGEIIAEESDMYHYFGGSQVYNGGLYGIALLSKYPILEESKVQFGGNRPVATITTKFPDEKEFSFVGAQLEDRGGNDSYTTIRIEHASLLLNYTKGIRNPAVLAAGFYIDNSMNDPTLEVLSQQYETGCYSCGYTFPKEEPVSIQDIILYKTSTRHDVTPIRYEIIESPTRGFAVYAEFEVIQ